MRLWSLHPRYLDSRGLVAVWRGALLAQAVLRGETSGYRSHPQLERFRAQRSPRLAINAYLAAIHAEATTRSYVFDRSKIGALREVAPTAATRGQIDCECGHLLDKLSVRSPALFEQLRLRRNPSCRPLFRPFPGPVASWERAGPRARSHADASRA